jgi:hypothetical protein
VPSIGRPKGISSSVSPPDSLPHTPASWLELRRLYTSEDAHAVPGRLRATAPNASCPGPAVASAARAGREARRRRAPPSPLPHGREGRRGDDERLLAVSACAADQTRAYCAPQQPFMPISQQTAVRIAQRKGVAHARSPLIQSRLTVLTAPRSAHLNNWGCRARCAHARHCGVASSVRPRCQAGPIRDGAPPVSRSRPCPLLSQNEPSSAGSTCATNPAIKKQAS